MTMNFGIAIETDLEAGGRWALIQSFSDRLAAFLADKSYGDDVENLNVGAICLRPVPGFEEFSKERKPKYLVRQNVKLLDGSSKTVDKLFSYDFKFDLESYEKFVKGTEEEALVILAKLFVNSLSNFEKLPKKVKSFDLVRFKSDITDYLSSG